MKSVLLSLASSLVLMSALPALAQEPQRPSLEALQRVIETTEPETRSAAPAQDRITARRIDVVDENGVVRMVLAAPAPNPIVDGIQYRRAFEVAGITLFNADGDERGGLGVADIGGPGMAVLAMDHANGDAIGWRVAPDGAVSFVINQAPPPVREPALGDRLIPGVAAPTRIRMDVAADGQPSISLADSQDRARLRLTVTPEGYGAIEFLNAEGIVVHALTPERDLVRSAD